MAQGIFIAIISFSLLVASGCGVSSGQQGQAMAPKIRDSGKGLKDYFSEFFPMGVAVSEKSLKADEADLIARNFNSLTPENCMKWEAIHPSEGVYDFSEGDSIVAFAQKHNMRVRGHCLCWHNQTPKWVFEDGLGKPATKAMVLSRLKQHIETVVKHYKGKVYAWDVVNEAISDHKDEYLRTSSPWYQACGEEYLARAFEFAHEADPDALLFYNDYNEIDPVKRAKIFRLITTLKKDGIPIHGVGLQSHWAINEPSVAQLDSTLSAFSKSGLNIQVTELDISVYSKEHTARSRRQAADNDTLFTAARAQQQVIAYRNCFKVFLKYKKELSGITFWNVSDRYSWLDNFPVRNRKDFPLLFDRNLKPKKAFWAVVDLVR